MAEVSLWFHKSWKGIYELERTCFVGHPNGTEIIAVRGKTGGAYRNVGSFQWTPGVKALAVILIRALTQHLRQINRFMPQLEGGKGSLASSLDHALNKQPDWLFDMFGADDNGNSYLRKLLLRSNSGARRGAPVGVSLNEEFLPPQSITVYYRDFQVLDVRELERLAETIIEEEQQARRASYVLSTNTFDLFEGLAADNEKDLVRA